MKLKNLKKRYWLLIIIVILCIIGYFISSSEEDKKDNPNDKIKYAALTIKTIENKQLISGRLSSSKEVNIKSELAGIIDALYVNVGDEVKKGQAIAKIRTLPDPKSTQDASRQIEIAKINYDRIQANYSRTKSLYDKEVISKQEYEIAQQEYKSAQTELSSAQNYMKIVKQGFSNKSDFVSNVIYSTIDGIVLDVPVKIGGSIQNRNTFSEGTTIAIISDMNEFVFKGQVNEKDLKYIEMNKEIKVNINALKNENFNANISRISPKGIDVAGITRFDIEAKLNVKPVDLYKIKSGFTATGEFLISKAMNVLSLEEKYIQYSEDTAFVMIKKEKENERKIITTGISDGQFIEIKSGLKKEDKVIKELLLNIE
jgi:HlyD family secretion protein